MVSTEDFESSSYSSSLYTPAKFNLENIMNINTMLDDITNIDLIMQRGLAGESLNTNEIQALMDHAIELLKYIEAQTLASISRARVLASNNLLVK